jgi:hypothetical protein
MENITSTAATHAAPKVSFRARARFRSARACDRFASAWIMDDEIIPHRVMFLSVILLAVFRDVISTLYQFIITIEATTRPSRGARALAWRWPALS